MALSKDAALMKELIIKAIDDHIITRDEYDQIIAIALKDGEFDSQEKALLEQLNDMIENKTVRFGKKE